MKTSGTVAIVLGGETHAETKKISKTQKFGKKSTKNNNNWRK